MALGQIHHVDIVPDAGAVVGGIVAAEHMELLQLAHGHLGDVGHQVVGDAVGVLTDQTGFMGADGVEVAQQGHVHGGVGGAVVGEDPLDKKLGGAVGIGGAAHGEILSNGHGGGVAVHRGGGGEDEVLHAVTAHGVEQHQAVDQVVGIVLQRLADTLAHGLESGEVHHGVNAGILLKQRLHLVGLTQVRLDKGNGLAHDLLHPAQRLLAGVYQVIHHDDVVARLDQFHTGMAADIAGAAADKNRHEKYPFSANSANLLFALVFIVSGEAGK